jgi:outer membrane receptor protein involved in Fe transport
VVLSYTNAGKVTERGVELGLGYQFTPEIRADVSFTGFDFDVNSQQAGDQLVPNTPSKKATIGLAYGGSKFDANASLRLVDIPGPPECSRATSLRVRRSTWPRDTASTTASGFTAPPRICWTRSGSNCTAAR